MGRIKGIIIAGHGTNTQGKRTPNIPGYGVEKEHTINCRTAFYLAKALLRCGFEIQKVGWKDKNGEDDPDTPICTRQNIVRASGADFSIDCHADASNSKDIFDSASGAGTWISDSDSKLQNSRKLANIVQSHLCDGTVQKDRGVKRAALGMCNATYMRTDASILVEIGFMTNLTEAKLMTTDKFCKEQAEDICKGVCEFYGKKYVSETAAAPGKAETVSFDVGTTYTLKYGMRVRKTPEISLTNVLRKKDLTADAQKHSNRNGILNAGTKITCKDTAEGDGYIWIKTPSGWVAAYNKNKEKFFVMN